MDGPDESALPVSSDPTLSHPIDERVSPPRYQQQVVYYLGRDERLQQRTFRRTLDADTDVQVCHAVPKDPPTHTPRNPPVRVPTGMCNIATTVFPASLVIPGLCQAGLTSMVLPVPDGPCIFEKPGNDKAAQWSPRRLATHAHAHTSPHGVLGGTRLSHCQPQLSKATTPHHTASLVSPYTCPEPSSKLGFG
ncbi:hypothetical protein LZ31DRAFT_314196 [Colletotrichum somersetense]|nr:hypothetical protein LZ31DRAFT_314196 [Colletotrichum somersetense]